MRRFNLLFFFSLGVALLTFGCRQEPNKSIPDFLVRFPAGSFAYPVGDADFITERRDSDMWYNAQDFAENRHLGEDWNKTTGGNTDCGEPVYSTAEGRVVFAADAGPGWGNVVIVEHVAPDGTRIQSLYGHLQSVEIVAGDLLQRRENIGAVGDANGRYPCHLHFEIRWTDCPLWNKPGVGYADNKHGWIDPSEFIERTR